MTDYTRGVCAVRPLVKPPYSIVSPGAQPVPGESLPRRVPKAKDGLRRHPFEGVTTAFELIKYITKRQPNEPAIGTRKLVKIHHETTKVAKVVDGQTKHVDKEWTFFELADPTYLTYSEYLDMALQLGSGLRNLGLQPKDMVHIYASTSAHWLAMAHACASQSMSIVTAYDTLGQAGLEHTLLQSQAKAMFVEPNLLKTAEKALKNATSVKYIIYNTDSIQPVPDSELQAFRAAHPELKFLSFEELRALGEDSPVEPVPAKPEDLFCIMYTSGTNGSPKGVMHLHSGFIAAVAGFLASVEETVTHHDRVLAYLPLAHILELALEHVALACGASVLFASPRTLSAANMRNSPADMVAFKPTVMAGVPQVWETVRKGIVGQVEKASPAVRALFWGAIAIKSFLVQHNLPGQTAFDGIVFSKVRAITGGQLRFAVTGASGLAQSTRHFLSMVIAPIIGGYGLTETCGNGALGSPLQFTETAMGPMPASIEIKLVSRPEFGYTTDDPKNAQGEIYIRGTSLFSEYFLDPEETARTRTADGFFKTGDIGEFDSVGHLRIIDRVKSLVKLLGGEYVALEKLEAVYRCATVVQNLMVYASEDHSRPIVVIFPVEKVLAEKAAALGVDEHAAYHDTNVRAAVLRDLQAEARKAGLASMETVNGVVLVDEEWTPANGLVTATQKINRRAIANRFQKEIDDVLASVGP